MHVSQIAAMTMLVVMVVGIILQVVLERLNMLAVSSLSLAITLALGGGCMLFATTASPYASGLEAVTGWFFGLLWLLGAVLCFIAWRFGRRATNSAAN